MSVPAVDRVVAWAVIDFAAYCSTLPQVPDTLDFVPILTAWAEQHGLSLEEASDAAWDHLRTHTCSESPTQSRNS